MPLAGGFARDTAAAAIMVLVFLAVLAAPGVLLKLFGLGLARRSSEPWNCDSWPWSCRWRRAATIPDRGHPKPDSVP
jgi:hypothetical protein